MSFASFKRTYKYKIRTKKRKRGIAVGLIRVRSPTVEDTWHVLAWPGYICSLGTQRRMTTWNSSLSIP